MAVTGRGPSAAIGTLALYSLRTEILAELDSEKISF
jgi:hypothetical protein